MDFKAVEKELHNFTIKVNDYRKWQVVKDDEKGSSWIHTQQAELYKVKDKPEEVKACRKLLGAMMTCREELDKISAAIKYVVWPITSDVKKFFVSQMFHLIQAKTFWDEIASSINGKKLFDVAHDVTMMTKIHQCLYDFEYITRAVETKCEKWRLAFPRLFLLSDEELINFMEDFPKSSSFSKLFHFDELVLYQDKEIRAVRSKDGEVLRLIHPVKTDCECCPAKVLRELEGSVCESLKEEIMECMKARATNKDWYVTHLGQAITVALWVEWTRSVEEAFKGGDVVKGLAHCLEMYRNELNTVLKMLDVKSEIPSTKHGLIVLALHSMVVTIEELIRSKANSEEAPQWRNKLKFYWKNDTILVKCEDNLVEYGYEFYGSYKPLIQSPETRNLAFPLIMASFKHLIMAGLCGPAGTGKSESTRDMGFILGKPVYTFFCSFEGKISVLENFTRAASYSSGIVIADEMNRMQDEKKCMELWLKLMELREAGCKELVEEGRRLPLGKNFTVIATIASGYEKVISYLTCATLPVPDFTTITESRFYLAGYPNAKELSDKLSKCINSLREKLSHALQYDFGLRMMTHIIEVADHYAKEYKVGLHEAMAQAFHTLVWGRLEKGDAKLYDEVMKTYFDKHAQPHAYNLPLISAIFQLNPKYPDEPAHKYAFMYEAMKLNKPVLLISGDEHVVDVLKDAAGKIYPGEAPVMVVIDMDVPHEQLYGRYQDDVWNSGSVSKALFSVDDNKPTWILFKGTLTAMNVECLLTTIGSERTFMSGDGSSKKLAGKTKLIFVTPTVDKLSPGIISRVAVFKMQ